MARAIFSTLIPILAITSMMCNSHPVIEEQKSQPQGKPSNNLPQSEVIKPVKTRQEEGVGEFGGEVGAQVGQIVNGVFTANVGDIFDGTLPFIDDGDVQTGVGTIFSSLTKPLNSLWASGNKQALKYFGITEPTTANPLLANKTATASGTKVGTAPVAAVPVQPAAAAVAATEEPDDGGDGGEDFENRRLHA